MFCNKIFYNFLSKSFTFLLDIFLGIWYSFPPPPSWERVFVRVPFVIGYRWYGDELLSFV